MNRKTHVAFPDSNRFLINRSFIKCRPKLRMKEILIFKKTFKDMKKNLNSDKLLLKITRIMKNTTILLFIFIIHASAIPYAEAQRVSVRIKNGTFYDVITQIEKQSEFMFFYKSEDINNNQPITLEATNRLVTEILDEMLNGRELSYQIVDRQIVISRTNSPSNSPPAVVQQQGRRITGTVFDDYGEPIIGANIIEKGTTNGVISDLDGRFTLTVQENATLQISFIGFITQEIPVRNQTDITVTLREDLQTLDEVVVVGYGTQARRDISGSITTVSAENLKEMPVTTFAEALMGQAAGLFISLTGAPGAETSMRIRGVGSINAGASDPLVIVDGVSGVSIESINPNDIESTSILKDASATAIYGARGANGVILITTKQGSREGRTRVTYDGYVGVSTMANNGYDVMNAWEQMEFIQQGMINARDVRELPPGAHSQFGSLDTNDKLRMPYAIKPSGYSQQQIIDQWGSVDAWVASYQPNGTNSWMRSAYYQMLEDGYSEAEARKGTNWYKEVVQDGFIQNHNLSLQGGGERNMHSLSLGISQQEGTFKESFFNRYSLRANLSYYITKYLTIGGNINLSATEQGGDRGVNLDTGGAFAYTLAVLPWVPVYAVDGIHFAGTQASEGGRAQTSVTVTDTYKRRTDNGLTGQATVFAELRPIDGLVIKTQYSPSLNGRWETSFSPISIFHNKEGSSTNSYTESSNYNMSWQWTNTVSYNTTFNKDHSLAITAGTEAIDNNRMGRSMSATRRDYIFEDDSNTWTINNGNSANQTNSGNISTHYTLFGYFGRAEYSYKGTYILNASIRRDASSRFAEKNRWGTFPSISAAWRVSDETFMQPFKSFIDDMKFRVGYGTTGNSNTGNQNAYNWAFPYGTGADHSYDRGGTNTSLWTGYGATALGDANAKWETVRTLNIGFDITAFRQRLTINGEWYTRETADMLVQANWSAFAGSATKPRINIGSMSNKGVDFSVAWRDRTRLFNYNISANISTYRNHIKKLGSADLFYTYHIPNLTITTEGQPIGMFHGYKILGVYKSVDDVLNYTTKDGQTVLPIGAPSRETFNPSNWVGRYKIQDTNGDGEITTADNTIIGNPHPDFVGGLNASITYRNFDFSTQFYFSVGNEMLRQYMYYTHYGAFQAAFAKDRRDNSWHPETNPDGIYPLWALVANEGNEAANQSNSMYIEDGSYLRMRSLVLGYSLPQNIVRNVLGLERLRLYAQISNVFTLTKYSGLDPEIRSSSEMNKGVDMGGYGIPRQFIFGLNISFQ